jgi:hypothetical protein
MHELCIHEVVVVVVVVYDVICCDGIVGIVGKVLKEVLRM